MKEIPQYTQEQIAMAKAKAERIRTLIDLVACVPGGNEGTILVFDGYARQLERELAAALEKIEVLRKGQHSDICPDTGLEVDLARHCVPCAIQKDCTAKGGTS